MDSELLAALSAVTPEEKKILSGRGVDKSIYTGSDLFTIESGRVLGPGRLIDVRAHTRFIHFPRHMHDYIEIIYMCSGSTTHIINDTNKVVLKAGELLFLNKSSSHEILPAGRDDIAVNFIVLPQFFDVSLSMAGGEGELGRYLTGILRGEEKSGFYLVYRVAGLMPVQNLIENLIWSIKRGPSDERIDEATMGLMLMELASCADRLECGSPGAAGSMATMRALGYIEGSYRSASLGELSAITGRSVYGLSRLIKKETGRTFKELLVSKRLGRASELLIRTDLTVTEIIYAVGYENTSYFYREFRSRFGMAPQRYRAVNKK